MRTIRPHRSLLLLSCLLLFGISSAVAQNIYAFAGISGTGGYSGDGGPATQAKIYYPYRSVVDKNGNVYFADMVNAVIRRVSTAGIITTVAGNGTRGYSGDGGPATAAQMQQPIGLALDNSGNLYICDYGQTVVRKVTAAGIISTYAGNGTAGFSGDGGPATAAQMNSIEDVATDAAGNLYISDAFNRRIRKVSPAGIITTFAGSGTSGYSGDSGPATMARLGFPSALTVDQAGNIYVADLHHSVIRKIDPAGMITTFAGTGTAGYSGDGGPATQARFALSSPDGLAVDAAGNVYAADYQNHVIRKINMAGVISTIVGTGVQGISGNGGPATAARLWFPIGVAVDGCGNLFITDPYNNQIRKVVNGTPPHLSLQPSDTSVCVNASAGFSVQAANAGSYQWMVNEGNGWLPVTNNGLYSGASTAMLTINAATGSMSGYRYACLVSNTCGSSTSDDRVLTVTDALTPSLSITSSATTICQSTGVTFTALATHAGNIPVYQWRKNGLSTGTNSPTYTDASLTDGDRIECRLTSSLRCLTASETLSNEIVIQVLDKPTNFLPADTSLCPNSELVLKAAGYLTYQWSTLSTQASITVTQPGTYWLEAENGNHCKGRDSISIVPRGGCSNHLLFPTAFTPDGNRRNDVFRPSLSGALLNYQLLVYNRWGQLVFASSDPVKGWDGCADGVLQQTSVFVWTCAYQFENQKSAFQKGTITLIR